MWWSLWGRPETNSFRSDTTWWWAAVFRTPDMATWPPISWPASGWWVRCLRLAAERLARTSPAIAIRLFLIHSFNICCHHTRAHENNLKKSSTRCDNGSESAGRECVRYITGKNIACQTKSNLFRFAMYISILRLSRVHDRRKKVSEDGIYSRAVRVRRRRRA